MLGQIRAEHAYPVIGGCRLLITLGAWEGVKVACELNFLISTIFHEVFKPNNHHSAYDICRYITQEGHKLEVAPKPPVALTNAVSWRGESVKYRKNEVFLDVIESVNLLVSLTQARL